MKNGVYVLHDGNGTADFWKAYKRLFTKDGKETNCVQCQYCGRFDEYDSAKGLKTLKTHIKNCCAIGAPKLDAYIQRDINLTKDEKSGLNKAAVNFCYMDMRPFTAIQGKGLKYLLEAVSAISSKYGKLTPDQLEKILPTANTVIN